MTAEAGREEAEAEGGSRQRTQMASYPPAVVVSVSERASHKRRQSEEVESETHLRERQHRSHPAKQSKRRAASSARAARWARRTARPCSASRREYPAREAVVSHRSKSGQRGSGRRTRMRWAAAAKGNAVADHYVYAYVSELVVSPSNESTESHLLRRQPRKLRHLALIPTGILLRRLAQLRKHIPQLLVALSQLAPHALRLFRRRLLPLHHLPDHARGI